MKKYSIIAAILLISGNLLAQEPKLESIPKPIFVPTPTQHIPNPEVTELLQGQLSCSVIGIPIEPSDRNTPFKVYTVENRNWMVPLDVYTSISANVPGVQVTHGNANRRSTIKMRGTSNTVVIVDGIGYDSSILNRLNPADIESVTVSNNPAAELYFRFR